jgi:hypothetical protein
VKLPKIDVTVPLFAIWETRGMDRFAKSLSKNYEMADTSHDWQSTMENVKTPTMWGEGDDERSGAIQLELLGSSLLASNENIYETMINQAAGLDLQDETVLDASQDELPVFLCLLRSSHSTPASIKSKLFLDDLC